MTGWYPDPGGQPDRYRYWDGESWSEQTSGDPADPPPGSPGWSRHVSAEQRRYYSGAAFGVAALALVVVVVSTVVIIRRTPDPDPVGPIGGASSTASGWSDSRRLPQDGKPGRSPSAGTSLDSLCPIAEPAELAPHPMDGRVHGGRLSMIRVPGYSDPQPEYMLSWMSDTEGVSQTTEPGWQSVFAVGELQPTRGFATVHDAAHSSMTCALHTSWYQHPSGHKVIRDEPIMVDGNPGWILTWNVYDHEPGITVAGDVLTFVAVDDGRMDAFSMWLGMVPIGDTRRMALDAKVLADLKVSH